MRYVLILFILSLLSGCFGSTIKVDAEPVKELVVGHPAPPPQMVMREVKWTVLNREQLENFLADNPGEFAFFILTDKGYENLSLNMQEIIRYISEQKEVMLYYRRLFPNESTTVVEGEPNK
jgi:hypothetical protein